MTLRLIRPYGGRLGRCEDEDSVKVIGHELPGFELEICKMGWELQPVGLNDLTEIVWLHLPVDDVTEEAGHIVRADRDEIMARLRVVTAAESM